MMIDIDLIGTSIGSLIGKETNSISSRLKNELLLDLNTRCIPQTPAWTNDIEQLMVIIIHFNLTRQSLS